MRRSEEWNRRLSAALNGGNPLQGLNRLRQTAASARQDDRLTDVLLALQDVLEKALASDDRVGVAAALQLQASCLEELDEEERAVSALLVRALQLSRDLEDRYDEAAALHELGRVRWKQRREREAGDCLARAVLIFQELGDHEGQALTLHEMALLCRQTGQWAEAVERLHEALEGYSRVRDVEGQTAVRHELTRINGPSSG